MRPQEERSASSDGAFLGVLEATMATLLVIFGLCGSGKTDYLFKPLMVACPDAESHDEGFLRSDDFGQRIKATVKTALLAGRNCVIVEVECCFLERRAALDLWVAENAPGTRRVWVCYENDREKANKNCIDREKKGGKGDAVGHVQINGRLSPRYTIPHDAVTLKINGPSDQRGLPADLPPLEDLGLVADQQAENGGREASKKREDAP